ncbi:MAG: tyrosine-type recombinase/integrase, partial [Pirellulales bacterium]|nr:tyrosine-type recombinase/integrase [Pirellulales bacterium]
MARRTTGKPWLHEPSGYWCTSVARRRIYLDKDYKVACRKLRELRAEHLKTQQGAGSDWLRAPFADLADEFLDDVKARRKPQTHLGYRNRLARALGIIGPRTLVQEICKLHLARLEQRMTADYSPSTVKDTIAAVQAVFAWAVRLDVLVVNPLIGYKKPQALTRSRVITDAEFDLLLQKSDTSFQNVLQALRWTGCRPGEIRTLTWDCVDLDAGMWILKDHKTITQQRRPRPRIIPLPDVIWNLCRELAKQPHVPTDHVFLNARQGPYSKDALCRKMTRLRSRAKIEAKGGEQISLYSTRHTFGTEASGRVTDIELAALLGHTDCRTTQRYVHINTDRLREIQRRASRPIPENGAAP